MLLVQVMLLLVHCAAVLAAWCRNDLKLLETPEQVRMQQ